MCDIGQPNLTVEFEPIPETAPVEAAATPAPAEPVSAEK